jgi:dihydroorotase
MTLPQVIERVTCNAAQAIKLTDKAGSLRPGMPADITVFREQAGEFELSDCHAERRKATQRIVPVMAFKNGRRVDVDLTRCEDESNWIISVAEDHVPAAAAKLSAQQREFLRLLERNLAPVTWLPKDEERLSLPKATRIKGIFETSRIAASLSTLDALNAVYGSFLDRTFNVQIALFLMRMERSFVSERLRSVADGKVAEAALAK